MAIHRASRAISCLLFGHVYTCIFSSRRLKTTRLWCKSETHREFPSFRPSPAEWTDTFSRKSPRKGWPATWRQGRQRSPRFYPPPLFIFPHFTRTYRRNNDTGSHLLIRGCGLHYTSERVASPKERTTPYSRAAVVPSYWNDTIRTYEAVIECRVCRRMA